MSSPADCRFSDSHEWFRVSGNVVTIGISQFAANELTDITYVEMKPVGAAVKPGDSVGEVESVKTTSDVYSAIGGQVVEINSALASDPGLVNSDPFGKGWLVKVRTTDASPLAKLMNSKSYDERHQVS